MDRVENLGDVINYYGVLTIAGNQELNGYISYHPSTGVNEVNFDNESGETIWDFAEGLEHEMDSFVQDIIEDNLVTNK